jgi:hypothetical protein
VYNGYTILKLTKIYACPVGSLPEGAHYMLSRTTRNWSRPASFFRVNVQLNNNSTRVLAGEQIENAIHLVFR